MIQNARMLAAAQIIKRAKDAMSESGRLTRDLYWDHRFRFEDQVIIPVKEWNALAEALTDWEELNELTPATDDDWREWVNEECEDGPSPTQRLVRRMNK